MAGIEVISSSLVGMSSNATSMSRLELTAFDIRLLLLSPIQRALLFRKPQPQNFIPHLENSLSRALDFFPPLAGRLATTSNDDGTTTFFVDCNNARAEFTRAVAASLSISDILDPKYVPEIISSFFVLNGIRNYQGVSNPLIGVQVTELADGLVIACTANHVVVDGISFWHFVNSWSEISRGLDTISKSPVFDRCLSTAIRLPPLEKHLLRSSVSPPLLERVFHFRKESLAKLKAKANSEAGTDRISSLQALSAHLWRSYARCRPQSSSGRKVHFFMAGELLEKGLGSAALKINEIVGAQTKEMAVKSLEDWMRNPTFAVKGDLSFMIASSPRHNVYGNDFGWGKSIAVRNGKAQIFDGKVTAFPAAGDGGVDAAVCFTPEEAASGGMELEVCLPEVILQAMEDDAEFMTTKLASF
nr:flavonoid acyl/acetyl transferase [Ocimum tenuiflorum]